MKKFFYSAFIVIIFVAAGVVVFLPGEAEAISCGARANPAKGLNCAPDMFVYGGDCVRSIPTCRANETPDCDIGQCVCVDGFQRCGVVCEVPEYPGEWRNRQLVTNCSPGQIYDWCTGCSKNVLLSPQGPQGGFITITGGSSPELVPGQKGSLFYKTEGADQGLKVWNGASWQAVGANYTAEPNRNIDAFLLANNKIAVVPNPNFDKLTISDVGSTAGTLEFFTGTGVFGDKLSLLAQTGASRIGVNNMYGFGVKNGIIYQKSPRKHQWYSFTNADESSYVMQIDRDFNDNNKTHLTVRGDAGRLTDIILRDGNSDRWALSSRDGTPNFEIWRTNTGIWLQTLTIDYSTGAVRIPGHLQVDSALSVLGNAEFNYDTTIGGNLTLNGGMIRGATDISASGNITAGSNINAVEVNANRVNVDTGIVVNGGGITVTGQGNITSRAAGGVARLRVTEGIRSMAFDDASIQTQSGDLLLQEFGGNVRAYNDFNVDDNLDVGGVIRAGTYDIQITAPGGGLKMADLANEDFNKSTKGMLTFTVKGSISCTDVCYAHHGLVCSDVLEFGATGLNPTILWVGCGDTYSNAFRMCFCKG